MKKWKTLLVSCVLALTLLVGCASSAKIEIKNGKFQTNQQYFSWVINGKLEKGAEKIPKNLSGNPTFTFRGVRGHSREATLKNGVRIRIFNAFYGVETPLDVEYLTLSAYGEVNEGYIAYCKALLLSVQGQDEESAQKILDQIDFYNATKSIRIDCGDFEAVFFPINEYGDFTLNAYNDEIIYDPL